MFVFVSLGVIPDKEVRVSVKALAVSCIGAAGALLPEAFFNSLYLEPLDGIPVEGFKKKTISLLGVFYTEFEFHSIPKLV